MAPLNRTHDAPVFQCAGTLWVSKWWLMKMTDKLKEMLKCDSCSPQEVAHQQAECDAEIEEKCKSADYCRERGII